MRTKKKILSVLNSDACKTKDKKCAKAIKNKLSHHKKKHHHHKTTITNKIYINNPKNSEEKEKPSLTPNPAPTAQGVRAEMPYQSLFNERQHFIDLIKGIKSEHSKFKDIYNASRTPTFETASIETQTDHTGDIPKKAGRPKGSKNKPPQMTVGMDSGTDTDSLKTPDQRERDYLNLRRRQHDADLSVEGKRYGALRGSIRDRLDTESDATPQTPKSKKDD